MPLIWMIDRLGMNHMTVFLLVLFLLIVLYILSTRCRRGHPELKNLQGWKFAHRGLHGPGCPENSLAAFREARDMGYGVELDVHLLSDGNLAVIHDSQLLRMTGQEAKVEDLTTERLSDFRLAGTNETIPEFRQVLELYNGRAPLIVELKVSGNNYAKLCRKTCEMLDGYKGVYCIESFDPRCVYWLKKHRPDVLRGQLTENYFKRKNKLPFVLKFLLTHQMLNFLTKPDFVAYRQEDDATLSYWLVRKLWGAYGVSWTLGNRGDYDRAVASGLIPIFENFIP